MDTKIGRRVMSRARGAFWPHCFRPAAQLNASTRLPHAPGKPRCGTSDVVIAVRQQFARRRTVCRETDNKPQQSL
jgi:hypothetical protein